ncbi:unnamed protein product, partial [Nesidiocoris tenuis]
RTSGSAPFDNARTGQRYPEAIGFRVRRRLTVIDRQPNVAVILQNGPNFLGRSGGKLFVVTGRRPAALASVTSFSSENGPPFIFSARSIRQNPEEFHRSANPAVGAGPCHHRYQNLHLVQGTTIFASASLFITVPTENIDDLSSNHFKKMFPLQEDKDLVHEFVQKDGLACLIKVGSDVDQHYQNYILRGT